MLTSQLALRSDQLFVRVLLGASIVWSDWKNGLGYFVARKLVRGFLLCQRSRHSTSSYKRSSWPFELSYWCWGWNSNTLTTSCEELTHWKRPWCWEGLGAGGEENDRGWDGWMASPTWCTWVWVNSGSWWWRGKPGVLRFMGSQRVGHDWATELMDASHSHASTIWECCFPHLTDKW